jgi:hypothetical protein
MKRLFFGFFLLFAVQGAVFSQGCNPGWETGGLIFPTPDSMQCVIDSEPFSGAFQINLPSMLHGILTLDSMQIDSINGLPPGITWFGYPKPLVIYADSSACISFIGTTFNAADSGAWPLTFVGHVVVTSPSAGTEAFPFSELSEVDISVVPYYQLYVINSWDSCVPPAYSGPTSIAGISKLISPADWSVYPNPGSGNFNVSINAAKGISGQLAVHDMLGRLIYQRRIESTERYQTTMDLTAFAPGMYLVQLISASGVISAPKPLVITGGER